MIQELFLSLAVISFTGCTVVLTQSSSGLSPAPQNSDQTSDNNSRLPKLKHPSIIIRKKERSLQVFDGGSLVKTYAMVLGFAPVGDKEIEGDGKTPEGEFYVFTKNGKSRFYLSLGLSYPAVDDARQGLAANLISPSEHNAIIDAIAARRKPPQKTKLGGEIYIHGGGTDSDWTLGCVALKNADIKELFEHIPVGTVVKILP